MKLSSVYVCQLLIGLACSKFAISDWEKKFKKQNQEIEAVLYWPNCTTLLVSTIDPIDDVELDIKGRYMYNPDEFVEWAPDRPVYVRWTPNPRAKFHTR